MQIAVLAYSLFGRTHPAEFLIPCSSGPGSMSRCAGRVNQSHIFPQRVAGRFPGAQLSTKWVLVVRACPTSVLIEHRKYQKKTGN